jgi:hypothetical protein
MKLRCKYHVSKIDHGTKWDETTWILEACGSSSPPPPLDESASLLQGLQLELMHPEMAGAATNSKMVALAGSEEVER